MADIMTKLAIDAVKQLYNQKTVTITISMPLDLLTKIENMLTELPSWNRSLLITYLIHMGLTYLKVLDTRITKQEEK